MKKREKTLSTSGMEFVTLLQILQIRRGKEENITNNFLPQFENLGEMDIFLEKYKLPNSTRHE